MKILQLCKKFPYPVKDGESLAILNMARSLQKAGCEVTLLAMNTSRHRVDAIEVLEPYAAVHTVEVDNQIHPIGALQNLLFSEASYHVERFVDEAFSHKLQQLLLTQHFDIVQLETMYLTPYIYMVRQCSDARVVLRSHNVEHEIWERIAQNSGWLKKWYLNRITPRLRDFEVDHLNQYDLVAGITGRDIATYKVLGLRQPAVLAPIGLNVDHYTPDWSAYERPTLSLSFIGSLDWMPNIEGLRWFLDEVWAPVLQPKFPDLKLHIAGRNAPDWLVRQQIPAGVVYAGERRIF
jgi:polysaccharide biosynthesis protein PslH